MPDGVTLAAVSDDGERLVACESAVCNPDERAAKLAEWVEAYGLEGVPAAVIAARDDYQVQQVEAPQVPEDELADATRWRVKDLTDIPFHEASIAVFRQHTDRPRTHPMMFAAVARSAQVADLAKRVASAGLDVQCVVPQEAALAGLAGWLPDAENGVALLVITPTGGQVVITRGNRLYLARGHTSGSDALQSGGALSYEGLVLELQRSLDYFESQLSNGPAARLLVAPSPLDPNDLLDHLNSGLGVPSAALDLDHILDLDVAPDAEARSRCIVALAGALAALDPAVSTLYRPPVRTRDWLSADAMAGYAAGLVVTLGLASGLAWYDGLQADEAATLAESREAELGEQRDALQARLDEREPDPVLVERRDRLADQKAALARFRDHVEDLGQDDLSGFSGVLNALGRQQIDGLWLQRIRAEADGALLLSGFTLRGALVPRYLEGLADEAVFAGRRFREFRIQAPEDIETDASGADAALRFRVSSRVGEGS